VRKTKCVHTLCLLNRDPPPHLGHSPKRAHDRYVIPSNSRIDRLDHSRPLRVVAKKAAAITGGLRALGLRVCSRPSSAARSTASSKSRAEREYSIIAALSRHGDREVARWWRVQKAAEWRIDVSVGPRAAQEQRARRACSGITPSAGSIRLGGGVALRPTAIASGCLGDLLELGERVAIESQGRLLRTRRATRGRRESAGRVVSVRVVGGRTVRALALARRARAERRRHDQSPDPSVLFGASILHRHQNANQQDACHALPAHETR
jgi:hypothetical protein